VLIPKERCQGRPDQYRPITCLNSRLMAVLMEVLYEHVQLYDILPKEQYAVRRGHLDALLIDSMVAREARLQRRSLSVAWIDYRKAYDRIPHESIQFLLQDISAPVVVGHIMSNLI